MWPAFPASDYYGRSATRSPHRRGFNRARAAYPCDLPTRPGFPGSFADTRTLPLRPRPFCTRQRTAAPPDTGGHSWPCRRPRTLAGPSERDAEKHGERPPGPFPIPGSLRPDGFNFGGDGGCVSRRYWSIPVRGHTVALPGGTSTAMKPRLCSALSGELSGRRTRTSRQRTP
jgi:hypothetical protein